MVFLTTDGIRMGTGWDQDIGLLHLIQIGSVKSVVKIGSGLYQGGDQKIGKAGKLETRSRPDDL